MIKLEKVCCGYGKKTIVRDADVNFEKNKITVIVGPNGCGKTTLLKTMARLINLKSGDMALDDKKISEYGRNEFAKKVTFMPQMRHTPDMTVEDFLMCGRYPYMNFNKVPKEEDKMAVEQVLLAADMEEYRHTPLKKLSGGERQKVYFAMVLTQQTEVILLDEPTTYLDMDKQYEMLDLIKKMTDKTIVMVLHDLPLALKYADSLIVMEKGRIAGHGSVEEILESGILKEVYRVKINEVVVNGEKEWIVTKK